MAAANVLLEGGLSTPIDKDEGFDEFEDEFEAAIDKEWGGYTVEYNGRTEVFHIAPNIG